MIDHKLSNILLRPAEHLADHTELYARTSRPLVFDETSQTLLVTGTADFMTYLNACPTIKWRTYCGIVDVWLHLELTGDPCEVIITGIPKGARVDEPATQLARHKVSFRAGEGHTLNVNVPGAGMDLVGFSIVSSGTTGVKKGFFSAQVDEASVNRIRIALATTTFKKEHYIIPNIELMRESIGTDDGPIKDAFHMFVVDNGQTLNAEELSDGLVTVIPNRNVGGAGGFARGMLAALDAKTPFTHVILMDDDVHVFPESIKRTFNLLSLASQRYRDAFVNGAMLSVEQPTRLFEDVSHVLRSGAYHKLKPDLSVDRLDQVVANERLDVEVSEAYGAWWFSCIPTSAIRSHGLPLPLFVRCDDVEYGLRCKPTYMTMSGVCVWHESFEGRQRASVDCYQYVRNFLVMAACDGYVNTELFMGRVWRNVRLRLRNLDYGAAELLLDGIDDFLKGPHYLEKVDGATLMRENAHKNDQYIPIDEVDPELLARARLDKMRPRHHRPRTLAGKLVKTLPYDKHLLPDALLRRKPGHSQIAAPDVYDTDTFACDAILVLDASAEKAAVRRMDRARNDAIHVRTRELKRRYQLEHRGVEQAFREEFPHMVSEDFWRSYLGIG